MQPQRRMFIAANYMEESNPYARQGIARSLLALGRPDEARPHAEALVNAGSTDVNLLLLAAEARVASLEKVGAREILITLQKSEGRNANVMKRVADLYAALGDVPEAIAAYRGSLAIDERQTEARISLGRLLAKSGDDTAAIRELEAVLVTAPNHDLAIVELVGPYRRTGRSRGALPRLVSLIRRDVYHFTALIALGEILIDLARESDAMRAFERVLRFDPNHAGQRNNGPSRIRRCAGHGSTRVRPAPPFTHRQRHQVLPQLGNVFGDRKS